MRKTIPTSVLRIKITAHTPWQDIQRVLDTRPPSPEEYAELSLLDRKRAFRLRVMRERAAAAEARWLAEREAHLDRMAEAERLKRLFHQQWPDSFEIARARLDMCVAERFPDSAQARKLAAPHGEEPRQADYPKAA